MLGYVGSQSSLERYNHARALDTRIPSKFSKEIDCVYDWMRTREFMTAMDVNTKEAWLYLKTAMISPPKKVIKKYASMATESFELVEPVRTMRKPKEPCCRLCQEKLADNIVQKIKFSMIICQCERWWCHTKCADKYVMDHPQCMVCKQYFILSPCCSSIRSKLVDQTV